MPLLWVAFAIGMHQQLTKKKRIPWPVLVLKSATGACVALMLSREMT
jgi:hypothetical protein